MSTFFEEFTQALYMMRRACRKQDILRTERDVDQALELRVDPKVMQLLRASLPPQHVDMRVCSDPYTLEIAGIKVVERPPR